MQLLLYFAFPHELELILNCIVRNTQKKNHLNIEKA